MQSSYTTLPPPVRATHESAGDACSRGEWTVGARSETGYVRSENEDRMARVRLGHADAYLVLDGMGGHNSGALAAELAMRAFCASLTAAPARQAVEESLRDAFTQANEAVYARSRAAGESRAVGMGATAVALVTRGSRAMVAHVGDSRAYLVRGGQLRRLTRDHSRVQRMVDAGMLTQEQAFNHPDTSVIERAVGHQETLAVEIAPWLQLRRGDQLLLCSDGLCGYVSDNEIEIALRADAGPQALADALVELALSKGGHDNVTVQLVRYERPQANRAGGGGAWTAAALVVTLCVTLGASVFAYRTRVEAEAAIARLDARFDQLSQDLAALRIDKARIASPAGTSNSSPLPEPPPVPDAGVALPAAPVVAADKSQAAAQPAKTQPATAGRATRQAAKAKPAPRTTTAPVASPGSALPETAVPEVRTAPATAPQPQPEPKPAPASETPTDTGGASSGLPATTAARASGAHGLPADRRTPPSLASVARAPVHRSPARLARRESRRAIHARRRPGGARSNRRVVP